MKSINIYISERLVISKVKFNYNEVVKKISKKFKLKEYTEEDYSDNPDNIEDIEAGIKEALEMANIQSPKYFADKDELSSAISDGWPKNTAKGLKPGKYEYLKNIIDKDSKCVFDSNDYYGLTITANNKGFYLSYPNIIRIFIIDENSDLINDII